MALAAAATATAGAKYFFTDQSASDPAFAAFRASLIRTAASHNTRALRGALAPAVEANLNNMRQPAGRIIGMFFTPSADNPLLWDELLAALQLGAIQKNGGFCAPSVGCDGRLRQEEVAIVGGDVPLLKSPEPDATVLERLSHDVVHAGETSAGEVIETRVGNHTLSYQRILSPLGRTGYVESRFLRGPLDYRFYFKKYAGVWKLDAFSSGP